MNFITENLTYEVLFKPIELQNCMSDEVNRLCIITGYIDVNRIKTHILEIKDGIDDKKYYSGVKVDIIVGMIKGSAINERKIKRLKECIEDLNAQKGMPKVSCSFIYSGKEVHSKVYIWCKNAKPILAYCGSLNYTMNAFEKRRESVAICDSKEAYQYFKKLKKESIDINDNMLLNYLNINETEQIVEEVECEKELCWEDYNDKDPIDILYLTLLKSDGTDVGRSSGVNWGHRGNGTKRNLNEAYIPYHSNNRKRSRGFFPDQKEEGKKNLPLFRVILEHGEDCYMRLCQADFKGIQTAESNALLGKWIRKEIGVESGVYIEKRMLDEANKTYARFEKYADGIYRLSLVGESDFDE